jgi:arabinofuranan 3-O-arabinosyltransferase
MRRPTRDGIMALGFVGASFVLAFCQRPGWATSDTKIDLHVDPVSFVSRVASVWNPSIDLGAVAGAQYGGYLWPIGPFFAAFHSIGFSPWVVDRLWLGAIYSLAAVGVLKLLDTFVGRPRGVAHLVAATFYVLNPYTVMFTGRTSMILLGYVALPWVLLIVCHGVRGVDGWIRGWKGWWWAAAFALVLTSAGGGINGAVVGWMLVGPLLLLLYEPLIGSVRWRDSASFLVRMGALGVLASLWWIVPLMVHARYGIDFLQFTEQPRTIWATNSAPEALRLMAYWTSYVGVGFYGVNRPLFSEAGTMLFNPLVVGATLIIPALAVLGYVWSKRWRYAPFLLLLLVVGAVIEVAGFPSGTPARQGMEWFYRNVPLVRFMRTTQKAAPLVAMGVAGLLGIGAQLAWMRLRGLPRGRARGVALAGAPALLAALIALAALPLVRGTAVEKQITWKRIPAAWTEAGSDLNRTLPRNTRALVLPGQIFANYTWGGTTDAILPRLTDRPVAVRYETPYGDAHATDLLWTVDRLVQQRRLLPGQLMPLLKLMGVGAVISGSDDDITRSGAVQPEAAAAALADEGLSHPARSYGPRRLFAPPSEDLGKGRVLPEVRRYDIPVDRGLVHVDPAGPATIVDGGAEGLADMAAFGALPERRPILYAGDLTTPALQRYAARGADLVVTDSNRRRRFIPEFGHQNLGATLTDNEPIDKNFALINAFPDRGSDAQTVAALQGARYVTSPNAGGLLEFPEYDAIKAFDGDPSTIWAADRYYHPRKRWIEVGFDKPRDVPYVDLLPVHDWRGIEREVSINGVTATLHRGWNRIQVNLKDVGALRITLTHVDQPHFTNVRGNGGLREIRIPGVHLREPLRPPILAGRALAGRDLSRSSLTYLFERTTADEPFQRDPQVESPLVELPANRVDPENQIERVVFAPAARSYAVDARVHPAVHAPDSAIDRLVGLRGSTTFDSSGRFHSQPVYRASSAFDGRADTAWVGIWARPSAPFPWVAWRSDRPRTVSTLRLTPAQLPIRRPTQVRVSWPGGSTPALRVATDGTVALPRPVRARAVRITIVGAAFPPAATARERASRAVGIGSVVVPGLPAVGEPTARRIDAACGSVAIDVGGRRVPLRPEGAVADLLAGKPVAARDCAGEARMGSGVQRVDSLPGTFSVDVLRLHSPAAVPSGAPAGGGRVVDSGTLDRSSVRGVHVALDGPSWLVLGQSFNEGWRATCDGHSLGKPQAIDAYANGWLAPADCRSVSFAFAPQRAVTAGDVVSAIVCAALLAFLLWGGLGGRLGIAGARMPPLLPEERPRPLTLPRAAAISLVITIPLALLFAKRTSLVIFPLFTLVLWRAIGSRLVTIGAAFLIGVVIPLAYLFANPMNRGGYNFEYSIETITAHYFGIGALVLLMVACWRTIADARPASEPVSVHPDGPRAEKEPRVPATAPPAGAARASSGGG